MSSNEFTLFIYIKQLYSVSKVCLNVCPLTIVFFLISVQFYSKIISNYFFNHYILSKAIKATIMKWLSEFERIREKENFIEGEK